MLLPPTLAAAAERGLLGEVDTLHLDRGYDNGVVRSLPRRRRHRRRDLFPQASTRHRRGQARRCRLGMRWPIERTNSWLSNFGQLRRNTDRRIHHRLAQLALAIVFLITAKLIDWRNRWSPSMTPIRATS